MTTVYVIEGSEVTGPGGFWRAVGEAVNGPGGYFGRNRDAFADCLSGGFGTPEDGDFVLEWRDHAVSRRALGPELFDELVEIVHERAPGTLRLR
ncbi:barstar family protein [Streptomyces lavendulocolor]|uniref:Barstar family protein n=1 Tax=Streptomyces lavendulocolor TaxID=67316 RepID=A0ABV2W1K0_9ACTN